MYWVLGMTNSRSWLLLLLLLLVVMLQPMMGVHDLSCLGSYRHAPVSARRAAPSQLAGSHSARSTQIYPLGIPQSVQGVPALSNSHSLPDLRLAASHARDIAPLKQPPRAS